MTPNIDEPLPNPDNPPTPAFHKCKKHGPSPVYRWRGTFRCKTCKNEAAQVYRKAHPEILKRATDKYRAAYPDRVRASGRASYARNKDRWLAKRREGRRIVWPTTSEATDQK